MKNNYNISKLTKTGLKNYLKANPNHKCGVLDGATCPIAGFIRSQVGNTKIEVNSDEILVGAKRFTKHTTPSIPSWVPKFIYEFDDTYGEFVTVKAQRVLDLGIL